MEDLSVKATGRDLKFADNGDLGVDEDGDLQVTFGTELIEEALLRRLYTPPNGYVRQVYDIQRDEVVNIGEDYLNNTYRYLSTGSTRASKGILDALNQIGKEEDRIDYVGSRLEKSLQAGELNFTFSYRVKTEQQLRHLKGSLKGNS